MQNRVDRLSNTSSQNARYVYIINDTSTLQSVPEHTARTLAALVCALSDVRRRVAAVIAYTN